MSRRQVEVKGTMYKLDVQTAVLLVYFYNV